MSELLKKDTTIKIASLLFAIILWFVVNPVDSATIPVPLTVRGEDTLADKNLRLKNKDYARTVEVLIRGNKEKIKKVNGYEFEAILDFSKINSADETALTIDGPRYIGKEEGIVIQKVLQDSIAVDIEKLEKASFPVNVKTTGNPKTGYKTIEVTAIPDSMALVESDSLIKSVGEIRTAVNLNNIDRDTVLKKQACKVYNTEGKEIPSLSRNLTVDVKVRVAKEVPVTLVVRGKPAYDFTEGLRSVSPEKVLVTGSAEVLSKLTELKTEPVSIENANKTVEKTGTIVLPSGAALVDATKEVSVTVEIEPLSQKKFTILKENIDILNMNTSDIQTYEVKTQSIEVGIKGPKLQLASVSTYALKASIDVAGLGEGVHKVPLTLILPQDIRLDKEYFIEVSIQKVVPPQ